jgi:hypothetical protein
MMQEIGYVSYQHMKGPPDPPLHQCSNCGELVEDYEMTDKGICHECDEDDRPMKYYIVNEFDRPYERHVAVEHKGKLYYLQRVTEPDMKIYDGMDMDRATPIEDFGITVREEKQGRRLVGVYFTRTGESTAKYKDGKPRRWQGEDVFWHHAFRGV